LQSLAPTNPHWAHVVGYGPFSLYVIHKKGLRPSSGDINRLMMVMMTLCYPEWVAKAFKMCKYSGLNYYFEFEDYFIKRKSDPNYTQSWTLSDR
jgi:hypothetical protein